MIFCAYFSMLLACTIISWLNVDLVEVLHLTHYIFYQIPSLEKMDNYLLLFEQLELFEAEEMKMLEDILEYSCIF